MTTKTILVVEDEKSLRHVLLLKLKSAGYQPLEAEDGEKGLEVALAKQPSLILLDLKMPKMDGQTMLANLRKDSWGKKVPVIILTNNNDDENVFRALQQSAQDFLVKSDTSLETILETIQLRIG